MEPKLVKSPNIEKNVLDCLEYLKAVARHPDICPIAGYLQAGESWVDKRKFFINDIVSDLNYYTKTFLGSPVVFWLILESGEQIPLHRIKLQQEWDVFVWELDEEEKPKDIFDGFLKITTPEGEIRVSLWDIKTWIVYSLEASLLSQPRLPGSSDYTDRSYDMAFKSMVDQVTLVDPYLGKLVAAPGTMDYLILDLMAYLYDRLNTYIDFYASGALGMNARGEFLEKIAKYLGYTPVPPSPAGFPVVVKPTAEFLGWLNNFIVAEKDKTIKVFSTTSAFSVLDVDVSFIEDFPFKITIGENSFYGDIDVLSFRFLSTREFRYAVDECILVYFEGTEHIDRFVIRLTDYPEIVLTKFPVDLVSISGKAVNTSSYIILVRTPKEMLSAGSSIGSNAFWFLLSYDRDGRVKLIPLPFGEKFEEFRNTPIEFEIKYRYHKGSKGNGLRVSKPVSIPLRFKNNSFVRIKTLNSVFTISLDGWNYNFPFAELCLSSLDMSVGGYDGDTDDDIRQVISGYLKGEKIRSTALSYYANRGVIEEDYEMILKSFPYAKIFKTYVHINCVPLDIQDLVIPRKKVAD